MSSTDQFTAPWLLRVSCSGEVASSGYELTFLLISIWSPFLAFPSSTLTSIQRLLISVLSFHFFPNLLRRAAGELAFSLVDVAMRQREKDGQAQAPTGGRVGQAGCRAAALKRPLGLSPRTAPNFPYIPEMTLVMEGLMLWCWFTVTVIT